MIIHTQRSHLGTALATLAVCVWALTADYLCGLRVVIGSTLGDWWRDWRERRRIRRLFDEAEPGCMGVPDWLFLAVCLVCLLVAVFGARS